MKFQSDNQIPYQCYPHTYIPLKRTFHNQSIEKFHFMQLPLKNFKTFSVFCLDFKKPETLPYGIHDGLGGPTILPTKFIVLIKETAKRKQDSSDSKLKLKREITLARKKKINAHLES